MGSDRCPGRPLRHDGVRTRPQSRAGRHELQPLQADEPGRARPLALDGIHREDPARDRGDARGFPAPRRAGRLHPPGWDEIEFPDFSSNEKVYALEVSGDGMRPLYRDGDILVLSPTANVRRGDRVVVRKRAGEIVARELKRRTAKSLELAPLDRNGGDEIMPMDEVEWLARVMWARQ
jgi:hypothetical protein